MLFWDEVEDAPYTNSSTYRSIISPLDRIIPKPRKRVSPAQSSSPSPIPSYDDSTCTYTADDEVDSTSECADSEHSVPPTKMPVLDTSSFSSLKNAASDIENKYRDLHFENMKLRKKISDLECKKDELEAAKKNSERTLQEERKMHNIVKAKQQNTERCLLAEQEYVKAMEREFLDMENQLKREQSLKEQWKQKFEQVVQNVQSQLDACRQDNEPIIWFDGHDVSKLPQVNMMILMPHLPELTSVWEKLGVTLGVGRKVDIESTMNINTDLKCMHTLQFWMERTSSSWPPFLNALTKLNRQQLALQIERELIDKAK